MQHFVSFSVSKIREAEVATTTKRQINAFINNSLVTESYVTGWNVGDF